MRFRSKSAELEAIQWFPGVELPGLKHVPGVLQDDGSYSPDFALIRTINDQVVKVRVGDWVATEPDGIHHYPIAPEVFVKRWELIEPYEAQVGKFASESAERAYEAAMKHGLSRDQMREILVAFVTA